jgi:hypothetical protein
MDDTTASNVALFQDRLDGINETIDSYKAHPVYGIVERFESQANFGNNTDQGLAYMLGEREALLLVIANLKDEPL